MRAYVCTTPLCRMRCACAVYVLHCIALVRRSFASLLSRVALWSCVLLAMRADDVDEVVESDDDREVNTCVSAYCVHVRDVVGSDT
jgi:hypothetical protein